MDVINACYRKASKFMFHSESFIQAKQCKIYRAPFNVLKRVRLGLIVSGTVREDL